MLYLAIDQHRKQLTVDLRNEAGDVLVRRQVSTEWTRVREFLEEVRARGVPAGGFVAILEVCGFNDWLLKLLAEYGCRETVLVQPEKRSRKKTDRRDANALGERADERFTKASVREFRRPPADEQGDESPPPAPPTLSSVPEHTRTMIRRKLPQHRR